MAKNVQIKPYALLLTQTRQGYIKIGRNVYIGPFVILWGDGGIEIGDDVLIGGHTVIVSANHGFKDPKIPIYKQENSRLGIKIRNDSGNDSG